MMRACFFYSIKKIFKFDTHCMQNLLQTRLPHYKIIISKRLPSMFDMSSYLFCLHQTLSTVGLKRLLGVTEAMLCSQRRVTMLGLSRWSSLSYRTIQRFYSSSVDWLHVCWIFFQAKNFKEDGVYLLAGDETTVTKSGKCTHGLGRFFLPFVPAL